MASQAQLKKALLAIDDMPTGWSTDSGEDEDAQDSFEKGCKPLAALDNNVGKTPDAEVSYTRGELGPFVSHVVGSVATASEASRRIAQLKKAMSACPSFSYKDDEGTTTKVRIAPVSFPKLGDETFAVRISLEFPGGLGSMMILVTRIRNHVSMISGASITTFLGGGTLEPSDLEAVARKAVTKTARALP